MRPHSIVAAALSAAAVLVIGIGSTLARTSGGDIVGGLNPNASCTSANPCLEEDNKSTGSGLTGTSKKGTGIVGNTSFLSTSSTNAKAGVLGQDLNLNDTFNAGVQGTSKNGTGVFGKSTNNSGVTGSSANGVGVTGSGGVGGVLGSGGSSGFGLEGFGFQGVVGANTTDLTSDALVATGFGGNLIRANNSLNQNVLTLDDRGSLDAVTVTGDQGVTGFCNGCSTGAGGVQGLAVTSGGTGVFGIATISSAVGIRGHGAGGDVMDLEDAADTIVFTVDNGGNTTISGQIFTNGSCHLGCSRTRRIESYVPHESAPMSEDVGEAQFVGGGAYVRIDPAFANVTDRTANYSVFITPEGDNRGLYVTNKSPIGFEVRESQGGRSTLAFSYRIVAKPFGETEARLPMVNVQSGPRPAFVRPRPPARSAPKASGFPKP